MAEKTTLSPVQPRLFPALLKDAEKELAVLLHGTALGEQLSEKDRYVVAVFAAFFSYEQLMKSPAPDTATTTP
jgi:hypothetical protein